VFIVDPWLWVILGGTAFLLTSQTRWRRVAWGLLGGLLTAIVLWAHVTLTFQRPEPMPLGWLWLLLLSAVIGARWYGLHRYGSKLAVGTLSRRFLLGRAFDGA
jgi:hypothetical protein